MAQTSERSERTAFVNFDRPDTRDAALVQAFIRRHFSGRGAFRTHRAALGLDLLRTPINVALAPVFLVVRLTALILIRLRVARVGRWLASRRILLRSDVSSVIELALIEEVLRNRTPQSTPTSAASVRLVEEYVGIRNAVAEIATTLVVLCIGVVVFRTATPGVLSLAPLVSDHAAFSTAVAGFPLGQGLGRVWYEVFPLDRSGWFIAGIALLLVLSASVVTTFSGLVMDPVQAYLGIHRRRLMRLLGRLDQAEASPPGLSREHLLARLADVTDAATAFLRMLRP